MFPESVFKIAALPDVILPGFFRIQNVCRKHVNLIEQKQVAIADNLSVGAVRLERTTTWPPAKYANQLRYAPILECKDTKILIL